MTGGYDTRIFGEGKGRTDSWRSGWGGHHLLSGREGLGLIRGSSTSFLHVQHSTSIVPAFAWDVGGIFAGASNGIAADNGRADLCEAVWILGISADKRYR